MGNGDGHGDGVGLGAVFNTKAGELEEEDVSGLDADVLEDPESGCVFVIS